VGGWRSFRWLGLQVSIWQMKVLLLSHSELRSVNAIVLLNIGKRLSLVFSGLGKEKSGSASAAAKNFGATSSIKFWSSKTICKSVVVSPIDETYVILHPEQLNEKHRLLQKITDRTPLRVRVLFRQWVALYHDLIDRTPVRVRAVVATRRDSELDQ